MKQIKLFTILLAATALTATGCKKDKTGNIQVDLIEFQDEYIKIQQGDIFQPVVIVEPASAAGKLKWTSSDKSVVTVKNGILTAVGEGVAEIGATIGNYTALVDVEVVPKRYILSLMKLDNNNKGVLDEMKDDYISTTYDVDGEHRYIVLWDYDTNDYVKADAIENFDNNFTGTFIGEGVANCFAPLKTEWAMYGYHGILLITRKPCKNAQLNIRFNTSDSDWIQMTVHLNSSYERDTYFCLKGSDYPLGTLHNISNSMQLVVKQPNDDKTGLEQIKDKFSEKYSVRECDTRIQWSIETDPSGEFCYFYLKRKNNSESIELSDKVYLHYSPMGAQASGGVTKTLRFTTKAVTYYDILSMRF